MAVVSGFGGIADVTGHVYPVDQRGDDFVNGRALRSNTPPNPESRKANADNLPATSAPARTICESPAGSPSSTIPDASWSGPSS